MKKAVTSSRKVPSPKKVAVKSVTGKRKTSRDTKSDFSIVEDSTTAFRRVKRIGFSAGTKAALEAKSAGVARVYARDTNIIVSVSATGTEKRVIPTIKKKAFYIKYTPQTKLHAVKK